jgi:hypothetical protein
MFNKYIYAKSVDYTNITTPCKSPDICKRLYHVYPSMGMLNNRVEVFNSVCSDRGKKIEVSVNKLTERPFNIYRSSFWSDGDI